MLHGIPSFCCVTILYWISLAFACIIVCICVYYLQDCNVICINTYITLTINCGIKPPLEGDKDCHLSRWFIIFWVKWKLTLLPLAFISSSEVFSIKMLDLQNSPDISYHSEQWWWILEIQRACSKYWGAVLAWLHQQGEGDQYKPCVQPLVGVAASLTGRQPLWQGCVFFRLNLSCYCPTLTCHPLTVQSEALRGLNLVTAMQDIQTFVCYTRPIHVVSDNSWVFTFFFFICFSTTVQVN